MKTAFLAAFAFCALFGLLPAQDESATFDITTLTGDTYKNSRILKATPAYLSIMHDKGVARVDFANLPETWRSKFHYDPSAAEAFLAKEAEEKRQADARRQQQNAQREREERRHMEELAAARQRLNSVPPLLAPLPGSDPTPPPSTSAFEQVIPSTAPLGQVYTPGIDTRRSYRYGNTILTDGYYSPAPIYYYGTPYISCPPRHHHHRPSGYSSGLIIRISR